jgi:hypothetical protein
MTILEKIKTDLDAVYLGKKIRGSKSTFTVASIEVSETIDGLDVVFLDRVRDWPPPKFVAHPGQNTVSPKGDWISSEPKDLQIEWCGGWSTLPELAV